MRAVTSAFASPLLLMLLCCSPAEASTESASKEKLIFVSPADGAIVKPGQTLIVEVEIGPDVRTEKGVMVVAEDFAEAIESPPYRWSVTVPVDRPPGPFVILATTMSNGEALMTEIEQKVIARSELVSIKVEPDKIELERPYSPSDPLSQMPLGLTGIFAGGVSRNITRSPATRYSSFHRDLASVSLRKDTPPLPQSDN